MTAPFAYFLDIDGTLLDLASHPSAVRVAPGLAESLARLARRSQGAVALVSGRPIAEIDLLFPRWRWAVAGLHGLERRRAGGRITRHRCDPARLDSARQILGPLVARHAGLLVEDKGLSIAVHYRMAPALASLVWRHLDRARSALGPDFMIQRGKYVAELKPAGVDKGRAIRALMQARPFRHHTPVFLGDDATDEAGFAVVTRSGGYAFKVGRGPSAAPWRLPDAAAVRAWLLGGAPLPPLIPAAARTRRSS